MEEVVARDVAEAALIARHSHDEHLEVSGRYDVECFDAQGNLRWADTIENLVTTVGKNSLLDVGLGGSSFTAFCLGLVDGGSTPTYAAADTMSSHAGWTENVGYSNGTRPAPSFNAASAGAKATTATVFNLNATSTLAGLFLTTGTAKSGTTGVLYSCGSFTGGNRSVLSGDTLSATYTASVT